MVTAARGRPPLAAAIKGSPSTPTAVAHNSNLSRGRPFPRECLRVLSIENSPERRCETILRLSIGGSPHLSHITEQDLRMFVPGTLDTASRRRLLHHLLAGCAECRTRAGWLARLLETEDGPPPDTLQYEEAEYE